MSERRCKACGGTGHYAKTCARRESASPTAAATAEKAVETPENAPEKERAPTATPTAEAVAARKAIRSGARERKREAAHAKWLADQAAEKRRLEKAEAREYPWNHVGRERRSCDVDACRGCDGYLVRHTWQHDTTGERIVVSVPLIAADHPAPGEGVPLRWDGQIVRRRIKGVESVLRSIPSATASVYAADGTLTATYRFELIEAAS